MAMSKQDYVAWLAERHLQMFALKRGPAPVMTPAEHVTAIKEAFKLAESFLQECEDRNLKPWEREGL